MTERALRDLFAAWQPRLGLARWQIEIRFGACADPASLMEITLHANYDSAVVMVQRWVVTGDVPWEQDEFDLEVRNLERVVVHELLHCHTRAIRAVVDDLNGMLHPDAHQLAVAVAERAEEASVDRLAVALVAAWPQ